MGWTGYLAAAAFVAGLSGGVHCAAMCGPIVAACAGSRTGGFTAWKRAVAYNLGRILSYALAGAIAGVFGSTAIALRGGVPAQTVMALLAGAMLLVLAAHLAGYAPVTRRLEAVGGVVWRRVQPFSRHVLPADTFTRTLALGALWGWLPCGMVYAALTTAIATAHAGDGALVMLAFGLGTAPNLLGITFAAARIQRALQRTVVKICAAGAIAGFGVLALTLGFHTTPIAFHSTFNIQHSTLH